MRKNVFLLAMLFTAGSLFISSCSNDDDDDDTVANPEYIATDASFANFTSWVLEAEQNGPDPALGPAHQGNDSTVTRHIYFKDGQDAVNGLYPVGTRIVKQSNNPDLSINEVTAMVKRGNNFDAANNDWEYFVLMPDGTIATDGDGNPMRGAKLLGGMCLGCHTAASGSDYIFTKN